MENIKEGAPYLQEGTDAVVFTFASSSTEPYQENFANQFIDCKTRFKRMRNRSVRFFSVDLNTDSKLPFLGSQKFPSLVLFPAYNKQTSQFIFEQMVDSILIAKWIHKHADVKFDLKEATYFTRKEDEGQNGMMFDQAGNLMADNDQMMKLAMEKEAISKRKQEEMERIEAEMRRRGEL